MSDASSRLAVYLAALLVSTGVLRFTTDPGEMMLSRIAQRVLPLFDNGPNVLTHTTELHKSSGLAANGLARFLRQLRRHRSTRRFLGYLAVSTAFAVAELAVSGSAG